MEWFLQKIMYLDCIAFSSKEWKYEITHIISLNSFKNGINSHHLQNHDRVSPSAEFIMWESHLANQELQLRTWAQKMLGDVLLWINKEIKRKLARKIVGFKLLQQSYFSQ